MKLIAWNKKDQNKAVADPWTLVHGGAGLAAGLVNMPMGWAVTAAVLYEIVEHYAQRDPKVLKIFSVSAPEIMPNQIIDIVVFAIGVFAGHRYNEQKVRR